MSEIPRYHRIAFAIIGAMALAGSTTGCGTGQIEVVSAPGGTAPSIAQPSDRTGETTVDSEQPPVPAPEYTPDQPVDEDPQEPPEKLEKQHDDKPEPTMLTAMKQLEGAPYAWGGNHGTSPKAYVERYVTSQDADEKRRSRKAALDCSMAVAVAAYMVDHKNITYSNVAALQRDHDRFDVIKRSQAGETGNDVAIVKGTHSEVVREPVTGHNVLTAGASKPGDRLDAHNQWSAYNYFLRLKT